MSEETDSVPTAAIFTAKTKNGHAALLHTWFVNKLGTTLGERLFKELVSFVGDSAKTLPGTPGVVFDVKGGKIVALQQLN